MIAIFYMQQIKLQTMQNRTNKVKQKQQTWQYIIKLVQNANIDQSEQIKWLNANRKNVYRKQLFSQMSEQQHRYHQQQNQKQMQRKLIEEQVKSEKQFIYQTKRKRIKTEQKYMSENAQIALKNIRKTYDLKKYAENPFVSLVDKQDMRAIQTRNNFKLQNKLNEIQVALQKEKKIQKKESDKKTRSQYEKYVEKEYQKKKNQRQNFKKKYLSIKKWQKKSQIHNSQEKMEENQQTSLQKKYISFLDHQVSQLKQKRFKQSKFLDHQQSLINKSIEIPDSSPAYLGRNPYSNDRKRQLQILDKNLSQSSQNKIRSGSQICQSVVVSPRQGYKSALEKQSQQRRAHSNIKLIPLIKRPNQQKKRDQINSQNSSITIKESTSNQKLIAQSISKDKISLPQKQHRKYLKYDFIVGKHKTIII